MSIATPTTLEAGSYNGIVMAFTPLVLRTAKRYMGKGAEFEDLRQEGYRALLELIPKCKDFKWLPFFLKTRLPGKIRDAAVKLRWKEGHNPLDVYEEVIPECESELERRRRELEDMLDRVLSEEERDIVQALLEGFTLREIGEVLGITGQSVYLRVRKIREKLRPHVTEEFLAV
ncbi:sigma-70 family RNA polymerase sigma factor [Synergistaceae bacterium OttesenSCG-928-D05]|nr:sigma-70 family RNA polymerase sigma factor [Synergistaceae bacterium OttesenSCG-928-D05]